MRKREQQSSREKEMRKGRTGQQSGIEEERRKFSTELNQRGGK